MNSTNKLINKYANKQMKNQKDTFVDPSKDVEEIVVTPETDPECFDPEFIASLKEAREQYERGEYVLYDDLRVELGITDG